MAWWAALWLLWAGLAGPALAAPAADLPAASPPACEAIYALTQARRTVWQNGVQVADAMVDLPDRLPAAWRNEGIRLRYRLDLGRCLQHANAALWLARVGGPYRLTVDGLSLWPILPLVQADADADPGRPAVLTQQSEI